MDMLARLVVALTLVAPPAAASGAPSPIAAPAGATGLDTFAEPTRVQLGRVQEVVATLSYEELLWLLDTAKHRLVEPSAAFEAKPIEDAIAVQFPDATVARRNEIHFILLLVMMGDITGALRSYAVLMDRDMRRFTRRIVAKLDKVTKARSTVIRNFAKKAPPRAYAGQNPEQAAGAQDKSATYTQWVQINTQLMREVESSEHELVDALVTGRGRFQTLWDALAAEEDDD